MTQREFFTKVIEANISDELTKKAQELVAGLDKRNAQKSATQTKTQKENEEKTTGITKPTNKKELSKKPIKTKKDTS